MEHNRSGICYAFQKQGKCRFGVRCQYSHDASSASQGHSTSLRPCNFFSTPQGCKLGPACKFSHNSTGKQEDSTVRDDDTVSHKLDKWKKEVTQRQPLTFGLGRFFDQALQLVNLDNACRQDVIRSLATDRGLNKVLEVVSQNFVGMSEKVMEHAFSTQIVPFFRALSEEHVMSSPLLERHLGDICMFLYGVGGTRGEKLFAAVIQALTAMMPEPNISFFTSLEATLAVLSKIIEFASTAKVTPIYEAYATTLAAMVTPQVDEATDLLHCQAEKHLDSINKRLGIGKVIRNITNVQGPDVERPVFALQRSHPGRLVNGSPRHDNDFESIEDIQIMPTSEEIQSTHAEYLPLQDSSSWHKQGIPGLLDRHFRLLREDTIGQLRDSARIELEALQGAGSPRAHGSNSSLKKHTYHNALVELPKFDPLRGLEFVVSFDQPPELLPKSRRKRQEWWTDSKRLEGDALICLISSTQAVVFCSVCFPDDPSRRPKKEDGDAPDVHNNVLSNVEDRVRVIARPVELSEENIGHILGTFSQTHFQGGRSLVEFPGVLLPAFLPTLSALKAISKKDDLPFSDFLAPSQAGEADATTVLPPVYARRAGFRFSLDSITQDKNHSFDPSGLKRSDIENLQKTSALDETQASALLSSLSRSFALIQGPPGTGKSYTGVALVKTLVSNRKTGNLGPILVVTFTNHALDQSLEHLLDQGITQIVRLGSRSKSERLTDLNLRKVAEKAGKTKVEKSEYGKTRGQMKDEARAIAEHLKEMTHDTLIIRKYLARNNVRHDAQLFAIEVDKEGFNKVRHGSPEDRLRAWLHGGRRIHSNLPTQAITGVDDLYDLSHVERRKLYNHWLRRAKKPVLDAIMDRVEQFGDLRSNLDNIRNELDLRVLEQAEVIGVTTSGLARNLGLLRRLPSKILLCEEAGEVLESHLLTALLPSIEHTILIGDHLQLRPHVQCYELSQESIQGRQYALDTSLLERLVTAADGGVRLPFSRLDTQRRMHPSIAELMRTIKQRLSGTRYGEVIALRHNIDNLRGLVSKDEQPFKRVQELVRYARVVQKQTQSDFKFDDSVILQTRCSALTTALLLRCDLMILSDVLSVRSLKAIPVDTVTTVDFSRDRRDCETLFQIADQGQHHLQQAEALIFWAQFAALEVSWLSANSEDSDTTAVDILRATARERLVQARTFCAEHPQACVVQSEIEEVEKMLRESTFYSPVTNEEMKNVVAAMAREFRGTGHWYRCENGHPFTVGECGMPMQTACCPQCGGLIGGQSHQPAAGVTHANDLERDFGNMRL
ncbi:hypothetical protein D6D05_01461 [Aureobasidium pullulans]|nr:hypothetical protein D6D05_01461 [Aureobasidium pullulans]